MSAAFQSWAVRMHYPPACAHRKIWEYCYIAQALAERGMLAPGRRGLGFAVGQEPLTALFAGEGAELVATDLDTEKAKMGIWVDAAQHADSLFKLNRLGICDPEQFKQHVAFRPVDMRELPDDLGTFDFIWSSCAFEHLGSMELGETFVYESMKYVNPGGWAVHTTEYNVSSNTATIDTENLVLFRQCDIERIATRLQSGGHHIDLDLADGNQPWDLIVDMPPFKQEIHLKLQIGPYVATSIGLIIRKAG